MPIAPASLDENGIRRVAAGTLGLVMAGHTLLETGVDALFLVHVSVERLPFVTIAVAILALALAQAPTDRGHRSTLLILLLSAAVGTLGFWVLLAPSAIWSYYLLYIWSGTITSVIVVRFWLVLGEYFTISQGKRLFASIAMGGSLGALIGSTLAAYFAPRVGAEGLLVISTLAFAVSAFGPMVLLRTPTRSTESIRDSGLSDSKGLVASIRGVLGNRYACRIAVLVMLGGMTLTLGDYLFKSVLTEEVASGDLATVLARIYLGLNVLSISMLAIGVTPLVQRLGVDRSLIVLPSLLGLAAVGVLLGSGFVATIFLKGVDGTLRYSLHKTATELLYLPMTSRLRTVVKGAIDIVGQTAAKSLASMLLLGLVALGWTRMGIAGAVLIFAALWVMAAFLLRHAYLDVFRETLSEGMIETEIEHPELDLESAGSLIQALSVPDERRVLAAMRILAESGHADFIPSLILYHPSSQVVIQALQLFATTRREDLSGPLQHLLDHEDANVRAASVRAGFVLEPDQEQLERLKQSECLAIRVSAATGLLALGAVESADFTGILDEVLAEEGAEPRLATVNAAVLHYHPGMRDALLAFARDEDREVASQAIRAIRGSEDAWFTDPLVGLLGDRRIRDDVRCALIERGASALSVLAVSLTDPETPLPVQRHIPRTIARFGSREAAVLLIESLSKVDRGMVRFKILRGLETLLLGRGAGPQAKPVALGEPERAKILDEFTRTLQRSSELLEIEKHLARMHAHDPRFATLGGELLVELLEGKRELASERLFSILGLLHPIEDFRAIQEGVWSEVDTERASAAELIETLLPRQAALGLLRLVAVDLDEDRTRVGTDVAGAEAPTDAPTDARDAQVKDSIPGRVDRYERMIQQLMQDGSRVVRAVALYHAGELGIEEDESARVAGSGGEGSSAETGESLQERALGLLRDLTDRPGRGIRPVVELLTVR